MTGVFITGTDTGAGKSVVATAIVKTLISLGMDVGVMKPVETGEGDDALRLKEAAASTDPLELICPYRLNHALAPSVAAEKQHTVIDVEHILSAYHLLSQRHDVVVLEGAGGVAVPITGTMLTSKLIKLFGTPCIVVGRAGLGTINHTYLTVEHLRNRGIHILAIVLNGARGEEAELDNPRVIRKLTRIETLCTLPWVLNPHTHRFDVLEPAEAILEYVRGEM